MTKFVVTERRKEKAKKIESILQDYLGKKVKNKKILDIGAGNGEIIEYFAKYNNVSAVDVLDQRKNKKSRVNFKLIQSERLPFRDSFFDIVITNHVIEHVTNQNLHLLEIKRVLKKGGVCYLATPNRLFPWECHHKTWFVHYLGAEKYHNYLKRRGLYEEDLQLLTYIQTKRLVAKYFKIKEYTHRLIKDPATFGFRVPIINKFPLFILKKLNIISQTNVFVLRK